MHPIRTWFKFKDKPEYIDFEITNRVKRDELKQSFRLLMNTITTKYAALEEERGKDKTYFIRSIAYGYEQSWFANIGDSGDFGDRLLSGYVIRDLLSYVGMGRIMEEINNDAIITLLAFDKLFVDIYATTVIYRPGNRELGFVLHDFINHVAANIRPEGIQNLFNLELNFLMREVGNIGMKSRTFTKVQKRMFELSTLKHQQIVAARELYRPTENSELQISMFSRLICDIMVDDLIHIDLVKLILPNDKDEITFMNHSNGEMETYHYIDVVYRLLKMLHGLIGTYYDKNILNYATSEKGKYKSHADKYFQQFREALPDYLEGGRIKFDLERLTL